MASRPVLIAAAARDPFVAELVRLLQSEGREVLVSHDPEALLRTARSKQPALVVLDTVLPGGDGISLCRRLREEPATTNTPIFVFSVLMARDRSLEAGATAFMLKPVEQEALLDRIREVLDFRVTPFQRRHKQAK